MSIEETETGETDPHHLGKVIHEIPRDPASRLTKIRNAGFVVVLALGLGSCKDVKIPHCPSGTTGQWPLCEVVPSPSPVPSVMPPPASPSPVPSVEPSSVPPTPVPPTPKPPKPCKVDESTLPCWTCAARLAYDVQHQNLTWDPGTKLYFNDPPGKAREYFDRSCNKVRADGSILRTGYEWFGTYPETEQGLCPQSILTCPSPSPTPRPSPSPSPSSSPRPAPSPSVPPIVDGNYPVPPAGVCPPWFANALDRVGIRVAGQTPCQQGHVCRRVTIWATQKSLQPYCGHAPGRRECEMWAPCQQPQYVDYVGEGDNPGGGIQMLISSPAWGNVFGRCDKQTCDPNIETCPPSMTNPVHNFNCHDKAVDRAGITTAKACMPDGSKCSETTYRTDQ